MKGNAGAKRRVVEVEKRKMVKVDPKNTCPKKKLKRGREKEKGGVEGNA